MILLGTGIGIIAVLVGSFLFWVRSSQESYRASEIEETSVLTIGDLAPEILLTNYEGTRISLSSFFGKAPIIINFWAAWCPFCLEELKDFGELAEEREGNIVILAINRAEPREKIEEYYHLIQPSENFIFLLDLDDAIYPRYNGRVMPYSVFVDTSGKIQYMKLGPMSIEEMRIRADRLIGSK